MRTVPVFIDASIVKAHRAAAGAKKGGIKTESWRQVLDAHAEEEEEEEEEGRTSKVHAAVDAKGRPLRLGISAGNVHDSRMMHLFLDWQKPPLAIVADKAYGSAKIRQQIADEAALAVIPSKTNARNPIPHDKPLYAMRNIFERFFCRMKDMRRLATRFEKHGANFLNMIYIFAIRCWLN